MIKARSLTESRSGARFAALAVACALFVGGCAGDDVELNGKIFDAVGLNNKTKATEPKMVARAPLVMPPNAERIPQPGLPPEDQSSTVAALADPDRVKQVNQAELERQQAAYCKEHYEFAKARGDDNADLAEGPLGPCKGSILTSLKKWTGGDEDNSMEGQVEQ